MASAFTPLHDPCVRARVRVRVHVLAKWEGRSRLQILEQTFPSRILGAVPTLLSLHLLSWVALHQRKVGSNLY